MKAEHEMNPAVLYFLYSVRCLFSCIFFFMKKKVYKAECLVNKKEKKPKLTDMGLSNLTRFMFVVHVIGVCTHIQYRGRLNIDSQVAS